MSGFLLFHSYSILTEMIVDSINSRVIKLVLFKELEPKEQRFKISCDLIFHIKLRFAILIFKTPASSTKLTLLPCIISSVFRPLKTICFSVTKFCRPLLWAVSRCLQNTIYSTVMFPKLNDSQNALFALLSCSFATDSSRSLSVHIHCGF